MKRTIAIKGVQRPGHAPVSLTVLAIRVEPPPPPAPDRRISSTERR